jgi:hypothetical protein
MNTDRPSVGRVADRDSRSKALTWFFGVMNGQSATVGREEGLPSSRCHSSAELTEYLKDWAPPLILEMSRGTTSLKGKAWRMIESEWA